jgi:3',5'-cyclic AMP phosphodiesterase CpdA
VAKPFVLLQLSDPHLGATWAEGDPAELLAETVDRIRAHGPGPDAVLVSGDLTEHATDEEYERVRELLEPLAAPIHVLPGNHDDRAALRRHFELSGAGGEPVQEAIDLGPLRLVVLDSTRAGEDGGELDGERLAWLEATLAADAGRPTVLALHHPPLVTGVPAWDELLFPPSDRLGLAAVVEAHPQVRRIVAGHLHRAIAGTLGGRSVLVAPSTYVQFEPDFAAATLLLSSERPGYAVHTLVQGELASFVRNVP